jgi:hypothetical protein
VLFLKIILKKVKIKKLSKHRTDRPCSRGENSVKAVSIATIYFFSQHTKKEEEGGGGAQQTRRRKGNLQAHSRELASAQAGPPRPKKGYYIQRSAGLARSLPMLGQTHHRPINLTRLASMLVSFKQSLFFLKKIE